MKNNYIEKILNYVIGMRNIWVEKIMELAIKNHEKYLSWIFFLKCAINESKKYSKWNT